MASDHEYCVQGAVNRSQVGRILALLAAVVSGGVIAALIFLVGVAKTYGIDPSLSALIGLPVGTGVVYVLFYWAFKNYIWKVRAFAGFLKVPDLSGKWLCKGKTLDSDKSVKFEWDAEITIVQDWDRLRVRLKTKQSGSNSVSASIICDSADGWKLMYNYENEPRIGEVELQKHHGFAELIFSKDLASAEGEYFNGRGRNTFGTMNLMRQA